MDEEIVRPTYYSVIPACVRYDKDLSASEKLFYSEITCLCSFKGVCFCSNKYFTTLYNVSDRSIQLWLKKLQAKNYIRIEIDSKTQKRSIYLVDNFNPVEEVNKQKKATRKQKDNSMVNDFMSKIC